MAIQLALTSSPLPHADIFVLSDSLSVLQALDSWTFKSPAIILVLLQTIQHLSDNDHTVHLIWCPGHKGVPPNELADRWARQGPYTRTLPWISPEDIKSQMCHDWKTETEYEWINSDYAISYPHLLSSRQFSAWISSRPEDVALARWRSRTILSHQRLFRMNLSYSPLCTYCYDMETSDHILLVCPRLNRHRATLFQALSIHSPTTYSAVLLAAFSSPQNLTHLIHFSRIALS